MTPQQKAKELVDKFRNEYKWVESDYQIDLYRDAKQCALIAVDEIIATDMLIDETDYVDTKSYLYFWLEVKNEINKL